MALTILMSDFNGKSIAALEYAADKKSKELGLDLVSFPENGLHPQFHMQIADEYLKMNYDSLILTHSENLLLRAMRRISNGEIPNSMLQLFILVPYINNPEKGFYWKKISICEDGEFIDHIPGGFFEQGYRERFDVGEIPKLDTVLRPQ